MSALRGYQTYAVGHLHAHPRAGLFLDMGLGKTAIVLTALTDDHLPALVVAPKRVAENVWSEEREKWRPDLTIAVAKGSPAQRSVALHSNADITVIGRENFGDVLKSKPARPWKTFVIDELSGYKGRGVRWKQAKRFIHGKGSAVEYVWGLTGTPSPNGLMDLWPQVYLLDKGERLHPTLTEFRSRYFTPGRRLPNGIISSWDLMPGMDEKIHSRIEDICLSMSTDGRVDLPPVTHNEVTVTLPPVAVRAYKELKDELVTNLEILGGEIHTAANAAILTGKLSQLTAGFIYGDDYDLDGSMTQLHSEKIAAAVEIVEGTGSPVLIFYRFTEELRALRAALPHATTINERDAIGRWNRGEIPVLLAHPASAGHGLNLQYGGYTIVWTSLPWSLEEWEQANKRLARSGQQHPVVIHRISARAPSGARTIDHLIHARLETKADVQSALLDHLEAVL